MAQAITAQQIKRAISFYYLLAYCPLGKLEPFLAETDQMREGLTDDLVEEVARRMVTFHTAKRQPDPELIDKLTVALKAATNNQGDLKAYQEDLAALAADPGRAKADNRLHRKKGCRFCEAPCAYGYFSLVSEPRFDLLMQLLEAEKQKAPEEKSAIRAAWSYAIAHITALTGATKGFITAHHLGNLAYCLLMLSMAKSRYPLPEEQIKTFQARNQRMIVAMTKAEK